MKRAFLILSGYNTRALTAFMRRLSAMNVPFYIIAAYEKDFIFYTKYKKHVRAIRRKKDLLWPDLLSAIRQVRQNSAEEELVLCPSSEYINHFALRHRMQLSEAGVTLPLVSREIYELVTNKEDFSQLCSGNNLEIPKRIKSINESEIPFVAKPKKNIAQGRTLYPYLVLDKNMLGQFMEEENISDYYFEEYIRRAESYYLLFYISRFGGAVSFSQKNILQQAGGKSIVYARPADLHSKEIGKRYLELLQKKNFSGLIMIELKKRGNQYIMIEANPRLWGPSQLFVDNDQPLFDAFIYETIFNKKYAGGHQDGPLQKDYLWLGGILQNIALGQKLSRHVNSRKSTARFFSWRALKNEVYLRKDTWPYFFKELKTCLRLRRAQWQ